MSTYGTVNSDNPPRGRSRRTISEGDSLLPRKKDQNSIPTRIKDHLAVDVSKDHGDIILLLCYVITGLLDSCATSVWGSFVSMQTGNTIYFGLGLANPSRGTRWIKAGISIASFCVGSFCFARYHRYFGGEKRWVLMLSFTIQTLMIVASAIITIVYQTPKGSEHDLHWHILVPIAIIAFQSSGQAVTSRVMQCGGLTSVVLTSNYCDLFSDVKLFSWPSENKTRNRRIAAPILLLIGVFVGGKWSNSDIGLVGALWTAAVLKFLIVIAWLLWRRETESDSDHN